MAFVKDKELNVEDLIIAIRQATRIGLRQTNVTQELPHWDVIQKRDRLTGVSMTGILDMLDYTGLSRHEWNAICAHLNEIANDEAVKYAKEMRVPTPLLVTCIKPEGSLSQLPTVSSGIHRSFAPYYIRRIRISSDDPLAKVILDLGYPVYPDRSIHAKEFAELSNREKINILEKANTWVIEFPVKTNSEIRASDESAKDQFQRYLDMQRYYVDHNTSITIYFSEDEIDGLVNMILENWDDYIAVSFLPKDTTAYPLMPYEEITESEYISRAQLLSHITDDMIVELLTEYERENMMTDLLDSDCANGACPIR